MVETWRLLDTGLGSAARNVALSRALLESRNADEITSTLRFLRYSSCALLACDHSPAQELELARCAAEGVPVQRRVTGGLAWLVDEHQLGWELYLHKRDLRGDSRTLLKRVLHAAATGLSALGIDARYRARDEIEVGGRTICYAARAAEGDGILVQALLLVEIDHERWLRILRTPARAAGEAALSLLRARVASLREVLGRKPDLNGVRSNIAEAFESEFDVEFRESDMSLTEHARYRRALAEVDTAGWVEHLAHPASDMRLVAGEQRVARGVLRVSLKYEASRQLVRQVWFSGEFGVNPQSALPDLEAALRDVPTSRVARQVEWFFASRPVTLDGVEPRDFAAAVGVAVGQPLAA